MPPQEEPVSELGSAADTEAVGAGAGAGAASIAAEAGVHKRAAAKAGHKEAGKEVKRYTMAEIRKHDKATDTWLVMDGKVYDVTKFVKYHPGGMVITTWAGRDATDPFYAFHEKWIRTKIEAYYIGDVEGYTVSPVNADFRKLVDDVENSGLMKTNPWYYVGKVLWVASLLSLSLYLALAYEDFYVHMLSAVFMFWFWHQSSFIGHDSLHNVVFRSQKSAHLFALLFSNYGNGISAAWWKYTHNQHHMVPNEFERDPDIMHLPVFAMTHRVFKKIGLSWIEKVIVSHQQYTFLPIMFVARINLYFQTIYLLGMRKVEKMPWQRFDLGPVIYWAEVVGVVFFWVWYGALLMALPSSHRLMYFLVSNMLMGTLHAQISLNHWAMDKFQFDEQYDELQEFSKTQIVTSRNIDATWKTHWFYGGLEFQAEHHLFPRMPRHSFSKVKPLVMEFAKKHNITYSSVSVWVALKDVLDNFAEVSKHVW